MSGHRVEWKHEGDMVCGYVFCDEPEGADCRLICLSGCESVANIHRVGTEILHSVFTVGGEPVFNHTMKDQGLCNIVEFIDNSGVAECYAGPAEVSVHDGLIKATYTGDDYEWEYLR